MENSYIYDNNNENNESLLEERTEITDKSLICVIKIIFEMRRATYLYSYFKRQEIMIKLCRGNRPSYNFELHMGWVI